MPTFKTNIRMGARYRDSATGFEGTATAVYFFQHGCERTLVKGINGQGEVVEYVFDAPELEEVSTNKRVELVECKTGGPHDRTPAPRMGTR